MLKAYAAGLRASTRIHQTLAGIMADLYRVRPGFRFAQVIGCTCPKIGGTARLCWMHGRHQIEAAFHV